MFHLLIAGNIFYYINILFLYRTITYSVVEKLVRSDAESYILDVLLMMKKFRLLICGV